MLKLRYYQKQAVDSFFDYTARNWGKHPIIVLPTAAGKSLVQAYIVKKMLEYNDTRILLITHQKELIKQNYLELRENFDNDLFLDVGIYSAGLNCRDTSNRILFAGIQSAYEKAWELGFFDVILLDECHLLPHKGEGMYRTFMAEMQKINKDVVIGGLSATAYRMKEGLLTQGEGALFHDICHETSIKELIDPTHYKNIDGKQYLCKLVSKNADNKVDLSNVHIRAGEYKTDEMQFAFQKDDLVCKAVKEIKEYTINRKKVLVFTAGIDHCEEVVKKMNDQGMDARCVHSKQSKEINEKNIEDFKMGYFKYLINVNTLTTGFNEPGIDCVVLLRSTLSPGLYYQMVGRLLRIFIGKEDGLVLDFGHNIEHHGPIDKIEIKKKKDGTTVIETAPQKECPECRHLINLSIMECPECGYLFPQKDKHEDEASEANILSEWIKPEEMDIEYVEYYRHKKTGKPDSLRVDYYVNDFLKYSKWVPLENPKGQYFSLKWLKEVTDLEINTVSDALDNCEKFKVPSQIIVDFNEKYPKITGFIYEEKEPEEEKYNIEDLEEIMF